MTIMTADSQLKQKQDPKESPKKWTASMSFCPSFHDVDPMGVVWHGNYLKFFEKVREKLFQTINYGYRVMDETGYIWPVVDVRIKYRHPWMLEEEGIVTATIVEYENRLLIQYEVQDAKTGRLLTKASTSHMAFDKKNKCGVLCSPAVLFEKLGIGEP